MSSIVIDGANGIGAPKMKELLTYLSPLLSVMFIHDGQGTLNDQVNLTLVV
jgi:hypothetical protein